MLQTHLYVHTHTPIKATNRHSDARTHCHAEVKQQLKVTVRIPISLLKGSLPFMPLIVLISFFFALTKVSVKTHTQTHTHKPRQCL